MSRWTTELLARAVEQYRRSLILASTNTAYGRLRADPDSWAELQAERDEWDATLADGQEVDARRKRLDGLSRRGLARRPRPHTRTRAGRRTAGTRRLGGWFNHGPAGLVIVVPMTTRARGIPLHVSVDPPEGGLDRRSFIKCEDVRSVSEQRLGRRFGVVSPETLALVADRLRIVLDL